MHKPDILKELGDARAELMDALEALSPEQLHVSGVVGIWSVKDILAHIAAWESELVTALSQAQSGRMPAMIQVEDIDEWNLEQYHVNADRPLEAILSDLSGVHKALLHIIQDFDERSLIDNRRYVWMEGEPLAYLIEESAYLHEREHADEIRRWREYKGL